MSSPELPLNYPVKQPIEQPKPKPPVASMATPRLASNGCVYCQPNPHAYGDSPQAHQHQHNRYADPLTTPDLVKSVYQDIHEDDDLTAPILSAHAIVLTSIIQTGCGVNYSLEQLELIERWLAAHMYQIQKGVVTNKTAGASSESYQMNTDFFLRGTLHGQQAMLFDTNLCLAKLVADTQKTIEGAKSFPPQIQPFPARYTSFQPRPIFR